MSIPFFETAASVATPIAAVCFLAALAAWAYSRRLKAEVNRLKTLAEPDRAAALEDWLVKVGLNIANLTREQKHEIALKKLQHDADEAARKSRNFYFLAAVLLACFLVAVFAYLY